MEPRAYFDPPCEREWTIEEQEEFFEAQHAITGLINGTREPDLIIEQTLTLEEAKRRYPNTPFPQQDDLGKTMGRNGYGAFKFADLIVGDQFYISWRGTSLFTKVSDKQAQHKDAAPQYFDECMACRLVPKTHNGQD